MEFTVSHDALGTHIDWALDGVTARMIDWFWSNMEKGFVLWHPEEHEPMSWPVPVRHGNPIHAVHHAPQTWRDGQRRNIYIRFERLEDLTDTERDVISHEHVIVAGGLGFSEEEMKRADLMGFRLHQWSKSDGGVAGRSSAMGRRKQETAEEGQVWAAHAAQEIGNWEKFLPDLYRLYKPVADTARNPFTDLSVSGKGRAARYKFIA